MSRIVDDDTVVAEEGGGVSVIPASNQKLFVAATALEVLGPDFRFRTELQSAPPVGGVVPGGVYLVGGGDPVLATAGVADPQRYPAFNTTALETLADQLVALGITTIDGDVVGDGSRYDDEFRVDAWGDDITSLDAGPYDALLVNDGIISPGNYGLDPSRAAARVFFDLLIARGITVTGAAANAARPADAGLTTLALIESRPLTDVLVEMLHTSDNNTAEMLVKEIGYAAAGQGTRQAGLDTVRATLERWGVPLTGVDLHDGSGLDRANRATCEALTAVVHDSPVADQLRDLLPVAGRDGTMSEQLLGTPAEGAMQAKTGTLTDVKALSGSQPGADRRPIEFSLVLNGTGVDEPSAYQPAWDALVDLIDHYPVVVEPDLTAFRTELTLGDPYYSTMGVMPMFPLGTPLLPGSVLPLHVFEPRYRQLVHDILADDSEVAEFGVVMIARGREVGGGDVRNDVGTVARVLDMRALPDGRYALAAVGADRLRVNAWLPDDPYPLADIDLWPDDDLEQLEPAARFGDDRTPSRACTGNQRRSPRARRDDAAARYRDLQRPTPVALPPRIAGTPRAGGSTANARSGHPRGAARGVRSRARRRRSCGSISLGVIEPGPMSDESPRSSHAPRIRLGWRGGRVRHHLRPAGDGRPAQGGRTVDRCRSRRRSLARHSA